MPRSGNPEDLSVRLIYDPSYTRNADGHPLIAVLGSFWGVPLYTDSLFPEPQAQLPNDQLIVRTF
jgi:hypothetical protein